MSKDKKYNISISLSDDYYSASLSISYDSSIFLSSENINIDKNDLKNDIMSKLMLMNINSGIDEGAILDAVYSDENISDAIIAKGERHRHGIDAYLTYNVNFDGNSKTIIKEDGTVDFKNLLQVSAVKEGDILVTKTPIFEGRDGITVTGKTIKHKPGKDVALKYGENVKLSKDGLSLISCADGIAKLINDRVTVLRLIEVDEVGPETGNIYFGGDVHVKGNVLSGYTIHCDGDLTVDGVVEGATLKVRGNLTVSKGILGHENCDIIVDGNLLTKFIENAQVYVKGELETTEIVNSTVLCDSKITVKGKKGLIIGGEITSKYMIEANQIGSRLGVITSINLGVDANVINELKELKEVIQELKILENRLKSRIPVLKQNALHQPEVGLHEDLLYQYEQSLISTQIDIEEKEKRLNQLMGALRNVRDGKVKINSIYPDTVIQIGNSKYFIDEALSACIISREDDQIIAIGISKF